MQGQRSGAGFFPGTCLEQGSTSNDAGLDQQMFWNRIENSGQSPPLNFMGSSSGDINMQYLNNSADYHGEPISGWDFIESSSMSEQNVGSLNDQKAVHGWPAPINAFDGNVLLPESQQHGHSNAHSAGNFANRSLFVQNSGSSQLPQDLNNSGFVVGDDDCQILETPPIFNKPGSSRTPPVQFSSSAPHPIGMSNGSSSDSRRVSRKRKAVDGIVEQPRGSGSTSYIPHSNSSLWRPIPNAATPMGASSHSLNLLEQVNPSLGSSTRQVASRSSTLLANSEPMETSRRNSRPRINGTHQQGSQSRTTFNIERVTGNTNLSSRNSLTIRPPTAAGAAAANTNPGAQPVVVQPSSSLHRNLQPAGNSSSGSRTRNSSSVPVSGERSASVNPSNSRGVPRNITDHPLFAQLSGNRNFLQSAPSWGIAGGNVNNPGHVASSSQNVGVNANANAHPAAPSWIPHQSPLQQISRLTESSRRTLLPAVDAGSRAQNSNQPSLHSGPSLSQGVSLSSGSRRHSRPSQPRQAMLLERNTSGAVGIPVPGRALAASNDGRAGRMSTTAMIEIRNAALELLRRGEGLRIQGGMALDPSVFFEMLDMQDQHRGMRLDVDNMSYEELLALEESMGSVNTGLSEESIVKQLKQKKHTRRNVDKTETEPCCICQEEYNVGEDVGKLDCGHDFHAQCIKQWLMQKNLCPICKTTGLTTK